MDETASRDDRRDGVRDPSSQRRIAKIGVADRPICLRIDYNDDCRKDHQLSYAVGGFDSIDVGIVSLPSLYPSKHLRLARYSRHAGRVDLRKRVYIVP